MMTREGIIELLQKIKYDEKGYSTNLQYYCTVDKGWNAVSEDLASTLHDISEYVEYRIKAEPKYAPFTYEDAELFWLRRIKRKRDKFYTTTIVDYDDAHVYVAGERVSFAHLLNDYIFHDSSPAGRLV